MPKSWSTKDERMYDRIKASERQRGRKEDRAEEVAARTVNKQRRTEGRTESGISRTQGTDNPNASLESRTVAELRNRAGELHIKGRSDMTKAELVRAIRKRQH